MKILIIGGKRFVGYHIATNALNAGHEVVFFNRGKTNAELFPECETIIGDRNTEMNKLKGLQFDYVIDTCAYYPSQVEKSLDVLEGNFKKYLFISTVSVVTLDTPNFNESVKMLEPNYTATEITAETYGPLKVACEEVVERRIGDKAIIIRPGYIVGDMDYTHRFTYVPIMMHYMDEVLVPETNGLRYSFIDGKDLGKFVIHTLDQDYRGVFLVVGPDNFYYEEYIELCRQVVNPSCKVVKKSDEWFKENAIVKPLAFPTCNDSVEGNNMFKIDTTKAKKHGLTTRPVEESIKDALDYFKKSVGSLDELKVGMNHKDMKKYLEVK